MAIFQCPRCGDEFETEYALGGHDCGAAPAMTVDVLVPPDIEDLDTASDEVVSFSALMRCGDTGVIMDAIDAGSEPKLMTPTGVTPTGVTPQQRWRAKNKDKHRAYMREYMRRYRAKKGAVVDIKA